MEAVAVEISGFEPICNLSDIEPADASEDSLDRLVLFGRLEPVAFEVNPSDSPGRPFVAVLEEVGRDQLPEQGGRPKIDAIQLPGFVEELPELQPRRRDAGPSVLHVLGHFDLIVDGKDFVRRGESVVVLQVLLVGTDVPATFRMPRAHIE